jgi:hypothetical protein
MQVSAAETRRRHGNGGLQEAHVSDARLPPVPFYLIAVDLQNFGKVEEDRRHGLLCEPFERPAIAAIGRFKGLPELPPTPFVMDGRDHQDLPVCGDVQGRFSVDLQQVQNRAVNHQRQAVAMSG